MSSTNGHNPRSTITVGASGADVVGATGRAIQIAIDALAQRGGGTVRVLPGEYVLEDSIRLRPGITLLGQREKTILRRGPLVWSPLAVDADIGQLEITPERLDGWRPGMGLCLWDGRRGWARSLLPLTVTDINGGRLMVHEYQTDDRAAEDEGRIVNHFPMILGLQAERSVVDGFTVDAAVDDPDGVLAQMRIAAVYFRLSPGVVVRNVTSRHARGDGICIADASIGVTVEDCETADNEYHGIHPGSHSARATVRRCHIHHNGSDGLYICWGVVKGEFTDNDIHHNGLRDFRSGISIGHKDTDCLIARNRIYENRKYGVCFRRKTLANGAHRAILRDNIIENNGSRADELLNIKKLIEPWESVGCGIHMSGVTQDVVIEDNIIRETRMGEARRQRHGVMLRKGVSGVRMSGNKIEGHPDEAVVDESGGVNGLEKLAAQAVEA